MKLEHYETVTKLLCSHLGATPPTRMPSILVQCQRHDWTKLLCNLGGGKDPDRSAPLRGTPKEPDAFSIQLGSLLSIPQEWIPGMSVKLKILHLVNN